MNHSDALFANTMLFAIAYLLAYFADKEIIAIALVLIYGLYLLAKRRGA